ncbi:MAG: hypothetical protein RL405_525, partial [Actinomycetota bacterium]
VLQVAAVWHLANSSGNRNEGSHDWNEVRENDCLGSEAIEEFLGALHVAMVEES